MSNEIKMNGRFVQKHDIEENWNTAARAANPFIPKQGEFIVYDDRYTDDDGEHIVADNVRYKIGDGVHNVEELPFNEDHIVNTLTNQDLIILHEAQSYTDAALNNLDVANNLQIAVTYSELKSLRDNAELIPGMFYRITDYICTTIQEDTQAMSNKFDIIVQALSNNTVSENASADYHYDEEGHIDGYFGIEEGGFRLKALYDIIEDETGESNNQETYKPEDIFIEYGYEENAEGDVVPTLFKTDMNHFPDEPDYEDTFYYIGPYEFDGIVYDRWRKIDADTYTWDNPSKKYVLTEVIVKDGEFDQEALNSHTVTQTVRVANLPAWELKYCLDNDTTRFSWADTEEGKGVIYYLKDEGNNECSYDFKNILFNREIDGETYQLYTFSFIDENNDEVLDHSMLPNNVRDNRIDRCGWKLNNIVFISRSSEESIENQDYYRNIFAAGCCDITFMDACDDNRFGEDCRYISLGMYCTGNTFKSHCMNNTLGDRCYYNTFETSCSGNVLENNCEYNHFDDDCTDNSLGDICCKNKFGIACRNNALQEGCTNNTLDDSCTNNTFGSRCSNNRLADSCINNIFGNNCEQNIFGKSCDANNLAESCSGNNIGNQCSQNRIGYRCNYNKFGNECNNNKIFYYDNNWNNVYSIHNTLGNKCNSNTMYGSQNNIFGNQCSDNIFGESCNNNTFGIGCTTNIFGNYICEVTFGNNCSSNTFIDSAGALIKYVSNISLANNCSNIKLVNDEAYTGSNKLENITISAGVSGKAASPLTLNVTRSSTPVVYEASGTTHVILD